MELGAVGGREGVVAAIRGAAAATGVDFDFLLRTAQRESSLNPAAKARTSSASGLFQFIDQTWLSTLKSHGAKHGYGRYAEMIERGANGRLTVPDAENRRKVFDLRMDATASARMGAELAADHASYLRGRIGREPTGGELYVAHFLGPVGSAKLIAANEATPGAAAASLFPAAAGANRSIFYQGGGALSVAEVYAKLTRSGEPAGTALAAVARPVAAAVEAVRERVAPAAITVRELTTPVRVAAREAVAPAVQAARETAAPAVRTVREIAAPVVRAVVQAAADGSETVDAARAALQRAERARRDALLIDLILGETGGEGSGGSTPFSTELLALLASAKDR